MYNCINRTENFHKVEPTQLSILFWVMVVFYAIVGTVSAIGNGMVLYASCGNKNIGRLRYLDNVIRSLAATDFLFGVVGIPCMVFTYYMGRI